MSQVNAMVQDVETISDAVERAHSILGLAVFAEPDQVKAAFRHRAFVCHPDAGGMLKRSTKYKLPQIIFAGQVYESGGY